MLVQNLIAASLMTSLVVIIHFAGMTALSAFLRREGGHVSDGLRSKVWFQGVAILITVFGLFFLHTLEIWCYAAFYMLVDQFETFEKALYFSTSTFTTVGFGDVILDEKWRVFGAIESATGFLLIGWSTAYLVALTTRIRLIEAELENRRDVHQETK